MNSKVTLIAIPFISLACLFTTGTLAQEIAKPNIKVKCFVDFYGGGQSIYTARLSEELYRSLPDSLINERVYTLTRDNKKKVYAVNECVLDQDKFKSAIANNLEKTMSK
ncbi:hypothetical protein [Thalassotalea profundi]|uniref:Uncharacterized protein n=1 Tax=Thalassotalea profundi TaxID=2036687 RepID=A0ABQ3II12_9GAMM|nr:hypothetical protein [Thalassotalea profundi]GHE79777.1 hypothetical protein GCM10011501_04410 [Thalassotalea profundi]